MGQSKMWSAMPPEEIALLQPNDMRKQDPARYEAIVAMLAEGMSINAIERACKASHHTVFKILHQEPGLNRGMSALVTKLSRGANIAIDVVIERLEDNPSEVSTKDLAVFSGIAVDKLEKLSGSQSPAVTNLTQININEAHDINALLASLPKDDVIDVEPVDTVSTKVNKA